MQQQRKDNNQTPQKKPTILIVDDQPENLELLVRILKKGGYHTRPALNGQLALGAVAHTQPDLILLDIRMPEMDGFEFCQRLKSDPQSCHIPVIFISALDEIDEMVHAFQAGGVDYISRPFQYPEVLARVSTHLELARMRNNMEALVHERTTALDAKTRKLAKEIATHHATAQQLRQSEENYRFLVESQNDLIIKIDGQNRCAYASPNVYSTFGKTEADIIGRSITRLIKDDNRPMLRQALADLAAPPHRANYQSRAHTKQGWKWFDWSAQARLDSDGHMIDVVSVGRDITHAKKAEIALRASEEKFRHLAENISEVFWIYSADWKELHYISPAYEQILGRSCQSLYKNPNSWLDAVIPQDRHKVEMARSIKLDHPTHKINLPEYRIKRPDKKIRWIHDSAFPVFNSKGEVYRIAGIAEDVTEKVELGTQQQQTNKMEAIGTLAGGIAHEFNNVLGIVIGNAELVMDDTTEGSLSQQCLDEITKAALRGKDVIEQLLKFSRRSRTDRIPIDLGQNVKNTLQLIRAALPATISITSQIDAPIHTVVADTSQISQLVFNLCNNAAQAMDAMIGEVKITLVNTVVDRTDAQKLGVPAGDYAKLSVNDTGYGIEPDAIDKIFDPYLTTHKTGRGSGMELAIVHGIVGSHKGAIKVQSLVGQGTRFDIYLPASPHTLKRVDTHPGKAPGGKETILFIDDEASIVRIAKTLLNRLGYTVWAETDPAKALQRFQNEPYIFNLVITDMTMPRLAGDRLAAEILKIREDTPIILCSGHRDRIDAVKFKAMGIRHYIEKPFEKHQFATVIRQALGGVEEKKKEDPARQTPDPPLPVMTENG